MAKSFLRGLKFFKVCPIVFNYAQQIFPRGAKMFAGEAVLPFPPGSGPVPNSLKYVQHIFTGGRNIF